MPEDKVFLRVDEFDEKIDQQVLESVYGTGVRIESIEFSEVRDRIKRGNVLGIIVEAGDEDSEITLRLSDPSFLSLLATTGIPILVPRISFRTTKGGGRLPIFERFDYIRVEAGKDLTMVIPR